MIARWLVQAALLLAPHAPVAQTRPVIRAIWRATHRRIDAAALLAISYHENSIGRAGVPFGVCNHLCSDHCTHCRTEPVTNSARVALRIWRRSGTRQACGTHASIQQRLRYYHSGACSGWREDGFVEREAATVARILARRRMR